MSKIIFTIAQESDSDIEVSIVISKKAKRLILKFDPVDGFKLVRPYKISENKALDFLQKQQKWILNQAKLVRDKKETSLCDGSKISILGKSYTISHTQNLRGVTHFSGDKIMVSGDELHVNIKIIKFLKTHLSQEIRQIILEKTNLLNVSFAKISIKDTKTRWGSCSSVGNLAFSWRLIFAPLEVLEYVVCHEVAHLKEMNHSDKFWSLVKKICPNYLQHKEWLKKNGMSLYLYRL